MRCQIVMVDLALIGAAGLLSDQSDDVLASWRVLRRAYPPCWETKHEVTTGTMDSELT